MLPRGSRVLVAVSGGPDSVCLLHLLTELAPEYDVKLAVGHFNHKLRGAASDEDEQFVCAMAARLGLPFYRAQTDVAAEKDNLEQAARRARREFFAQLVRDGVADRVALGHTRDDQAETVLFRLLRGSGLAGLAGILPVTEDGYFRPLIHVSRSDVLNFLRFRKFDWREDASNADLRFARNRIRHSLLLQLEREWNPEVRSALTQLADLAYEEEHYWKYEVEPLAAELLLRRSGGIEAKIGDLAKLPLAVQRRLIRKAIAETKGDLRRLEFQHIEQVLALVNQKAGDGHVRLPGAEIQRSFEWIRVSRPSGRSPVPAQALAAPGVFRSPDGAELHLEVKSEGSSSKACGTLKAAELYLVGWPAKLELRGWKPGDRYQPAGESHVRKLSEMFEKARVPSWRRTFWPMITDGDRILWARKFGPAAELATGDYPGKVLRVWEANVRDE